MKTKKPILILTLILLIFLSLTSVSASDNLNINNVTINNTNSDILANTELNEESNNIYVSLNGSDTNGNGKQDNPYQSINYAINKSTSGSTIILNNGEYSGLNNTYIKINTTLTITTTNPNLPTIINGAGTTDSIITINEGGILTLKGLTLTNGYSDEGGAIKVNSRGIAIIDNCSFINNKASRGGFMYNFGTLTLTNSQIINNTAKELGGGLKNWGKATITNTLFMNNYADSTGGAIYNFYFPMQINNCTFKDNSAKFVGGTIHNVGSLNLKNSVINGSRSSNSDAGAICNDIYGDNIGSCNITNTIITNSYAAKNGGAIFNNEVQKLTLTNCTITNSQARYGGAIYNLADLTLNNNTMNGCTASDLGNYIYNLGNIRTSIIRFEALPNSIDINKTIKLTANLTDDNFNPITNGVITFTLNNTLIDYCNVTEGIASINYTPKSYGEFILSGIYSGSNTSDFNSIIFNSTLKVTNNTVVNTNLKGEDLTIIYGTPKNYTIRLTDELGNPVIGQHIALNLSNPINGLSKIYWVSSDTLGFESLEINLAPGEYLVNAYFDGISNFNSSKTNNTIIVKSNLDNKTGTILSANEFNHPYNAGCNFTGRLTDELGNPVIGQHIALNLTNPINGLSKIYWVTTDTNGEYQLEINLYKGNYTAKASYSGNDLYLSSYSNANIIVN
ncbi:MULTISPECIES: hypothetical protein [unclassified Methanobrevibacter]|jgi:predicted outer membrane repeat protein|uniref:hypothetical protein n=1 Tax=unclassified Methanobrevibacter TaxID=2638681 RepID=UPI0039B994C6